MEENQTLYRLKELEFLEKIPFESTLNNILLSMPSIRNLTEGILFIGRFIIC
jgi:hypothetical protein